MSAIDSFLTRRVKITLNFPSEGEMWRFFETSDVREFRLDSANCSVTGRFLPMEIQRAQIQMKAMVKEASSN
jgi:hypothetical protein